jgi:hypothetical protein
LVVEREGSLDAFFDIGQGIISGIKRDMESLETIRNLSKMRREDRNRRFADQRYTNMSERLYDRVNFFVSQYYGIVDTSELLDLTQEGVDGDETVDMEEMRVEEFVELLRRKETTVQEVRRQARMVRSKFGDLDTGLAGLFTPRVGHAKDVSDWLDKLEKEVY